MTTRKQKTLAAMRRQAVKRMNYLRNRATLCINLGDKCMFLDRAHGVEWVLANVLTTPKPNRKRGGK